MSKDVKFGVNEVTARTPRMATFRFDANFNEKSRRNRHDNDGANYRAPPDMVAQYSCLHFLFAFVEREFCTYRERNLQLEIFAMV